jgi:hypothetical protein
MSRRVLPILAAAALATGTAAATAATVPKKPSLRLLAYTPLTVRGKSFKAVERVRIAVDGIRVLTVRASATGTFTAAAEGVVLERCGGGYTILATGSRGSSARLKLPAMECRPGLGP